MTAPDPLAAALDTMGAQLIENASKEGVELDIQIDVFKAVSAHYIGTSKVKVREPDDDDGASFSDLKSKIKAVS